MNRHAWLLGASHRLSSHHHLLRRYHHHQAHITTSTSNGKPTTTTNTSSDSTGSMGGASSSQDRVSRGRTKLGCRPIGGALAKATTQRNNSGGGSFQTSSKSNSAETTTDTTTASNSSGAKRDSTSHLMEKDVIKNSLVIVGGSAAKVNSRKENEEKKMNTCCVESGAESLDNEKQKSIDYPQQQQKSTDSENSNTAMEATCSIAYKNDQACQTALTRYQKIKYGQKSFMSGYSGTSSANKNRCNVTSAAVTSVFNNKNLSSPTSSTSSNTPRSRTRSMKSKFRTLSTYAGIRSTSNYYYTGNSNNGSGRGSSSKTAGTLTKMAYMGKGGGGSTSGGGSQMGSGKLISGGRASCGAMCGSGMRGQLSVSKVSYAVMSKQHLNRSSNSAYQRQQIDLKSGKLPRGDRDQARNPCWSVSHSCHAVDGTSNVPTKTCCSKDGSIIPTSGAANNNEAEDKDAMEDVDPINNKNNSNNLLVNNNNSAVVIDDVSKKRSNSDPMIDRNINSNTTGTTSKDALDNSSNCTRTATTIATTSCNINDNNDNAGEDNTAEDVGHQQPQDGEDDTNKTCPAPAAAVPASAASKRCQYTPPRCIAALSSPSSNNTIASFTLKCMV